MAVERPLAVPLAGGVALAGDLAVPDEPLGVVVFAHGSGSSRHSPRNRMVAGHLQRRGLATVLVDLLTEDEERVDLRTRHLRFDVGLLARRVHDVAEWVGAASEVCDLPLAYFGASTGAAAALIAAADHPDGVAAIVSRGGRPDLAGERLAGVRAPTLLIVGGRDEVVLDLNRSAQAQLVAPSRLEVVPGATHLFEEPGALDAVAERAGDWINHHIATSSDRWPRRDGLR
ncbi:MAG: dienelactone hydrolase family protein [Actinomycetota bacterium]|nr:dienelactone hydrolase family protein [Actinomycetota bacterium]